MSFYFTFRIKNNISCFYYKTLLKIGWLEKETKEKSLKENGFGLKRRHRSNENVSFISLIDTTGCNTSAPHSPSTFPSFCSSALELHRTNCHPPLWLPFPLYPFFFHAHLSSSSRWHPILQQGWVNWLLTAEKKRISTHLVSFCSCNLRFHLLKLELLLSSFVTVNSTS